MQPMISSNGNTGDVLRYVSGRSIHPDQSQRRHHEDTFLAPSSDECNKHLY